jgi:hypothetical protein
MSRDIGLAVGVLLLALGQGAEAQTDHAKERGDSANFSYSRDDQVVGGRMASLYLSLSPTWPPSDRMQISYSGQECTISYCWEFWGFLYCGCDFFSTQPFGGSGELPAGAFTISPQGVARLSLDPAEITNGQSYGSCGGFDLTAVPNGQWHWSENGQVTVETPTDVTRAVSRDDEWRTTLTGSACALTLSEADGAGGSVRRAEWNRVVRTSKP